MRPRHGCSGHAARHTRQELATLPTDRRFDVVFAINVNVFWVAPSGPELVVVRAVLRDNGVVQLFYELPDPRRAEAVTATIRAGMRRCDLRVTTGGNGILRITGRAAPRA